MSRQTILFIWIVAAVFVGVVHLLSLSYYLYWVLPWIDNLAHALGGLVVFTPFFLYFRERMDDARALPRTFVGLLLVDICWEIFELVQGLSVIEPGFALDTAMDTLSSFLGAFLMFVLIKSFEKHA